MNLHEYQAKKLLVEEGSRSSVWSGSFSQRGGKSDCRSSSERRGCQNPSACGRKGKAGGVKFGKSKEELADLADELIGKKIVNNQTGPEGVVAHQVLIGVAVKIAKEYYLGAIIDRERAEPILIASPEGGMEIEEVAIKYPEKILTVPIALDGSVKPYHLLRVAKFMGWKGKAQEEGMKMAAHVAKLFMETDGSLLEINPLVEDETGHLWALDAKLSVDDNALFRQPVIAKMYDPTQQPKNEVAAKEHDLAYISLSGNIGCMVNGAGLAMATMDIIQHAGGKPANFLDVGGGATAEKIAEGFQIIWSRIPK